MSRMDGIIAVSTVRSDCRQNKHSPVPLPELGQPDKPPHAISVYLYLTVAGYKTSCALPDSASQEALTMNTNVARRTALKRISHDPGQLQLPVPGANSSPTPRTTRLSSSSFFLLWLATTALLLPPTHIKSTIPGYRSRHRSRHRSSY
jgi:hypothetical protein